MTAQDHDFAFHSDELPNLMLVAVQDSRSPGDAAGDEECSEGDSKTEDWTT